MWDFSWLERRWPGAGYENWDTALDELRERGYDAVRIDAYPHLVAADPEREWELEPVWSQQDWGSPARTRVRVQPMLNKQVGYQYELFEPTGYDNMARNAEAVYRSRPEHWCKALDQGIDLAAEWARRAGKPLVTTEGWGVINYKDWPLLNWAWVKELCEHGVRRAVANGRWAAIATSTFCGPQFVGMWRDVAWHRRMTDLIHHGATQPDPR